ncbi:DUF4249 domain-containing protein [Emticicia sp. BO119]|uniref:DUF4249 domain-containing protein n=1 Tax=Emticicia sp. BO119 TaxID=2757768 RepID=UPI0015F114E5|nr:DUF4249 domain-containing protein [Emticicia sp. BO119]MBA4852538.1 DUF4249 domain-containing protein [Emticicia sp. BO119]
MSLFSKISVITLVLLTGACVTPFELNLSSTTKHLVVEGNLTDIDTEQVINIHETYNFKKDTYNVPTLNLKVELVVNGSEIISSTEKGGGDYVFPFGFRIHPGTTYKLRIKKPDGTTYESSEEKTTQVPVIDRIFDEFEVRGIKDELGKIPSRDIPANYIYLDFRDNPDEKDYYMWTWKLWERQYYCYTLYYDFPCNSECWEIFYSKDFNVFSDVYSNGKTTYGKLIGKVPFYSTNGALLEISQQAVSERVYRYFKLVSEQSQNSGTLVDTPPAAIVGNIRNINDPTEPVSGVFSVASTVKQKYWLDRQNGYGKASPIGLYGRMPLTAPNSQTYPCIKGSGRTPSKPEGWVN